MEPEPDPGNVTGLLLNNIGRIKICHQNICGVRTNFDPLQIFLQCESPDIVCLSEHNLTCDKYESFFVPEYNNVSTFCINSRSKGGVCILSKSNIEFQPVDVSVYCHEDYCQMTAARFKLKIGHLIVLAVYRPPGHNYYPFIRHISDCLDKIVHKHTKIIVIGDFNINILNSDTQTKSFIHMMATYNLRYTITSFTREFRQSKTTIDNIFTNLDDRLIHSNVVHSALSDHHAQEAIVDLTLESTHPVNKFIMRRDFSEQNTHSLRYYLKKEDWSELRQAISIDDKFGAFSSSLKHYMEICFPLKRVKCKKPKSFTKPVLTRKISQLKETLLSLNSATKDLDALHPLRQKYKVIRSNYKKEIRQCKSTFFLDKVESSVNKAKTIWRAVNEFKKTTVENRHITLSDVKGTIISDPFIVAESLNSFYSNIGKCWDDDLRIVQPVIQNHQTYCSKSLFLFDTNEDEVAREITALKPKRTFGLDEISSHLLKQIKDLISKPLAHLINSSFEQGKFPEGLKLAIVRPIYKKGNRHECESYRPICLISTLSKIFERIFLNRLLEFINKNNLLSRFQFGFTKGKNTVDAINSFISSIVKNMDKGKPSMGIFFDLTKAFDMVDHSALLDKLQLMGVRGISHSWISTYLKNRRQVVQIQYTDRNGYSRKAQSSASQVIRGVPQGSVLGPILFLLFINDLPSIISNGNICLFADDTSLSISANNHEELEVEAYVQANSLMQWFRENRLLVNDSKTNILEFRMNDRKCREFISFF